jgi:hypothetical protein
VQACTPQTPACISVAVATQSRPAAHRHHRSTMASSPNQGVTGVVQLQISLTTDQVQRLQSPILPCCVLLLRGATCSAQPPQQVVSPLRRRRESVTRRLSAARQNVRVLLATACTCRCRLAGTGAASWRNLALGPMQRLLLLLQPPYTLCAASHAIPCALAGHELVEADGFVFRRKRAALTPPSAKAATPAQQPGTTPHANPAGAAAALVPALQLDAAPTRSPARPGASLRTDQAASLDEEGLAAAECTATPEQQQQQPDATEQEQLMAQQETQQGGPLRFTMLPSELCDLVEWVVLDEARKLTGSAPEEARSAAAALRAAFASSLESWQRSDAATATDGAAQLVVLPYLVERKQAELRDKHARQGYSVT